MRRRLVIFVKEPRPGRVKSRLARDIGRIEAAWWYRHQSARLVRRLAADRRWQTVLAVAPDRAVGSAAWPDRVPRLGQGAGDLGRRMLRALASWPGPALVVGSDIPAVTPARVAEAFSLLGRFDVALGPAVDGGYWAIGRRAGLALPVGALEGVRWSGPEARHDTERRLAPLRIGHAAWLADVDRGRDLVAGR